eukprot:TRINITY_DN19186_c0_g1_i1.p1 TRINITY_DN19186_c0_g1~~TRINITY_DN19186_c0_g1_i1.p1  ORF type:complete len:555 (+),score=55.84 TRINITY_DN19186_c0_g1_i1:44-1666(+)
MGARAKMAVITTLISLLGLANMFTSHVDTSTEFSDVTADIKPMSTEPKASAEISRAIPNIHSNKIKSDRKESIQLIHEHNEELLEVYARLKQPSGPDVLFAKDLDTVLFGPIKGRSARHFWFPKKEDIPIAELPPVPSAPTGFDALRLADEMGYPRHWRARMRPKFFILGPPKTGTTFMHDCFIYSMLGNKTSLSYPSANSRWPTEWYPNGEPTYAFRSIEPQLHHTWNRTGFRRFDPPKESWLYVEIGRNFRYKGRPKKFWSAVQISRFPPVEPESKNWVVTDSTPDYLMIPKSAQALYLDMQGSPWKPRFVVMHRDPVARGYSHFLLFAELKRLWGWKKQGTPDFSVKLDEQHNILIREPICKEMLYQPEIVLWDVRKTYDALRKCMYEPQKLNDVMFLPFGFTALGLRYWLSLFDADQFTLVKMSTLKKMNTTGKLWDFYEQTFPGMKRMKPRCELESEIKDNSCTPWNRHALALERCGPNSPALAAQAWTNRSGLTETRGSEIRLERYKNIGKRWDELLIELMANYSIPWYQMPNK